MSSARGHANSERSIKEINKEFETGGQESENFIMEKSINEQPEEFPWHLGVHDAHCHPTDTMSSIATIPDMKARVLVVMSTREQDQDLVHQVAEEHGVKSRPANAESIDGRMIPCFGWHPWFSHQLFDERRSNDGMQSLGEEQKIEHYRNALTPKQDSLSEEDRKLFQAFPDPRPLSQFISETRQRLEKFPLALVGEVGLDKSFRIPEIWQPDQAEDRDDSLTPGGREGRRLMQYHVDLEHQKKILLAQLNLAGELQRAVSVHGVQAHGVLLETLRQTWKGLEKHVPSKKERKRQKDHPQALQNSDQEDTTTKVQSSSTSRPYPPRICLHSYSGNASNLQQYWDPKIPVEFYVSFSAAINLSERASPKRTKIEEVILSVPDERLLVESDLHTAGDAMDDYLKEMVETMCSIKGWDLEKGVKQLGENWRSFVFGANES